MWTARSFCYRVLVLLVYCFTITVSALQTRQITENTSFLITNVNRSHNLDSFTVQCADNSSFCCEYFGGESVSNGTWKDGYFLCICRCSTFKPKFSFEFSASPKCDVAIENPLVNHVKEAPSQLQHAAQQLATSPNVDAIYQPRELTTESSAAQGTDSTGRPKSENTLLIIIIACVVSAAVVIVVAVAVCLYQREKKVKLVRERSRSRIRSRSSQGSTMRRNNQPQGPPVHRYEYVDELSSNGPTKAASLPRTYNPLFDTDADDSVFVELPSITRGLTRPWSVAGCSSQGVRGMGEVNNQGYKNIEPMPFATRHGCDVSVKYSRDSPYKTKACHHSYKPDINRGRSTKSTSAGNIHAIQQSNAGYQRLIYKGREYHQRQHSASSPPHFEVPYQSLKASVHRRSDDNELESWLPSFEPNYQHLRYKRSSEKSQKKRVRVDSTSDSPNLFSRLSQSESCLIDIVGCTDEKDKSDLRLRSLSVDDIRNGVDESPLSPDDLRRNFYQALARSQSNQLESNKKEGDYEMDHIYQKCSDPDLDDSDSERYSSADHLELPVAEFDGSDSEGYARADILPTNVDNDYSADSEGYARADLLTNNGLGQPNELDVSDSEGYSRADCLLRPGHVLAREQDGSDSEGYARVELTTEVPLLSSNRNATTLEIYCNDDEDISGSEDCSKPLLFKISRDKLNLADNNFKTSSGIGSSVVDPFTSSSNSLLRDCQESQCQPDYMTLEETYQRTETVISCDRGEEDNDVTRDACPEYMVLETQPNNNSGVDEASSTREEADEENAAVGCPDYMVLEIDSGGCT